MTWMDICRVTWSIICLRYYINLYIIKLYITKNFLFIINIFFSKLTNSWLGLSLNYYFKISALNNTASLFQKTQSFYILLQDNYFSKKILLHNFIVFSKLDELFVFNKAIILGNEVFSLLDFITLGFSSLDSESTSTPTFVFKLTFTLDITIYIKTNI